MSYRIWTIDEEKKLENFLLTEKYSFKQIGKLLNRTGTSCQCQARRLNIESKFVHKIHSVNESFWDALNNTNCYWAGFSAADANVYYRSQNSGVFRLELSILDRQHLETFKNNINFNGNIYDYHRPKRHTSKISISSRVWLPALEKNFGIVPNKTKRMVPNRLPQDEFAHCWLIGYIDGDGTIHYGERTKNVMIKIVSSNASLLSFSKQIFQNILLKLGDNSETPAIKKINNKNCYLLTLSGRRAAKVINFLQYISCPKLSRKWDQENVKLYIKKVLQPIL